MARRAPEGSSARAEVEAEAEGEARILDCALVTECYIEGEGQGRKMSQRLSGYL
jgi:hypothetical protein